MALTTPIANENISAALHRAAIKEKNEAGIYGFQHTFAAGQMYYNNGNFGLIYAGSSGSATGLNKISKYVVGNHRKFDGTAKNDAEVHVLHQIEL